MGEWISIKDQKPKPFEHVELIARGVFWDENEGDEGEWNVDMMDFTHWRYDLYDAAGQTAKRSG